MNKIKILSLATFALIMASCGGDDDKNKAVAEAKPEVKITKVTNEDIPQTETYTATVESDVKNNISPNTPLRIEKILVDVGDVVRKGQVLVTLDQTNLISTKLQTENAKIEFERMEALYKIGGISKSDYDKAKLLYDTNATLAKQLAENAQLVAPVSGVVTARNYDNGDMYNGQNPVLTIEQTNAVKLNVNVSESYYKMLKKGMPATITLDAYEGEEFTGKVTIVSPSIDATTHTFKAEITINNKDQKVRPGMFARATIDFGSKSHTVIPDVALVKQIGAGDRYVYVYKDGKVSYNKVELGKHMGDKYEILSGVNAGDQVVIAGHSRLANGKEVEVVK
ncbi:MAG: efflux RND transporter periplasmic adaptor subunit [Bacteroidaceae bacterium]|nr:efflux RND transporter periplasmic adaptor subunit [Bacteroidaceae bacterium]